MNAVSLQQLADQTADMNAVQPVEMAEAVPAD
jgi:hypothetical protein